MSSVMGPGRFPRTPGQLYAEGLCVRHPAQQPCAMPGWRGIVGVQAGMGIGFHIGVVFVFISVVTLPMILIDQLYQDCRKKLVSDSKAHRLRLDKFEGQLFKEFEDQRASATHGQSLHRPTNALDW